MTSQVLSFTKRVSDRSGWTNTELAELYRVEHALVQGRIVIETDRGVTDEGDPWFIFCRADGEVVVHVTRFGGSYRLYSPALPTPLTGPSFSALTKSFLSGLRTPTQADATVSIHPAALLSVLVAAIFYSIDFHLSPAKADTSAEYATLEQPAHPQIAQHFELPTKDTLFHTIVTSIKALLEPSGALSEVQPFAFLVMVESAAVAAIVALSGLADSVLNLQSETVTPTVADSHNNQESLPDRQDDSLPSDHAQDQNKLQLASNPLDSNGTYVQDASQFDGNAKQDLTWAAQGNDVAAAANGNDSPANSSSNLASTADQPITDRSDDTALATIADGSLIVAQGHASSGLAPQHSDDAAGAANNAPGNQDTLSLGPSENAVSVNLAGGSGQIDVSASAGNDVIAVTGDGSLQISGIASTDSPQIVVGANFTQTISLSFASAVQPSFTIQLDGHDAVTVASVATNTAASVNLTLDSVGSAANEVAIADSAVSSGTKLNISVVGVQDLTLNESAQAFNNSTLDTTGMAGALTVGLDLNNVFQSVDLSQVNAANFVVGDSDNIALLQAASGSNIQLGSDLNIVDITIAGATATSVESIAVNLQTEAAQASPISVNLLDVFYTADLAIDSTGAGSTGVNTIETLTDSSLSLLTLTGNSALTIDSINGPSASDSQNITIDAHALTGSLVLDASGIADTAASGRSITIIGGAGTNVLTNDTVSESTTFEAGTGTMTVNLGGGAVNDSIVGLTATDTVNVGTATYTDVVINEAAVGSEQATIDQQTNVTAAAQLAASFAASTAAHQALLFSYDGSLYVFIDASGNHSFNANTDAIIKLVGLAATADLAGVFHSA